MPISVKDLANFATITPNQFQQDYLYQFEFTQNNFIYNYGTCFAILILQKHQITYKEQIMLKVLCLLLLSSALILSLWAFWLAVRELMSE